MTAREARVETRRDTHRALLLRIFELQELLTASTRRAVVELPIDARALLLKAAAVVEADEIATAAREASR